MRTFEPIIDRLEKKDYSVRNDGNCRAGTSAPHSPILMRVQEFSQYNLLFPNWFPF